MKKLCLFTLMFFLFANNYGLFSQDNDLFSKYEQILERGGIPAIVNDNIDTTAFAAVW